MQLSRRGRRPRRFPRALLLAVVLGLEAALPVTFGPAAVGAPSCVTSSGRTVCVTVPAATLTGEASITVTSSPNTGVMTDSWVRNSTTTLLMTQEGPAALTGDYSFVWPTQKYLDGSGLLKVKIGSVTVSVPVALSNGNATVIAPANKTPNDWASYLPPERWAGPTDPIIPAVGDGPDGGATSSAVAASIDSFLRSTGMPLMLFLGDIYENGTYTENRNHYGVSALDSPADATLWGRFADRTQPVIGNHETEADWVDYFHQRPLSTSYDFGGVRFLALDSRHGILANSAQYSFVENQLATAPACVIAYYHHPVLNNGNINTKVLPVWQLLAQNGADLVLNGHAHHMSETFPMDENLDKTAPDAHLVQLISGAGGHSLSPVQPDPHLAWGSSAGASGVLYLTLVGAKNNGTATRITWEFKDVSGSVLRSGSVDCGGQPPQVSGFTPTAGTPGDRVQIDGSALAGASDVTFNGTSAGTGNFTVNSDTSITATVPPGATTGKVCVVTSGGTGCSASDFTVETPAGISYVGAIGTATNTTGTTLNQLSVTVGPQGVQAGDTVILSVAAQTAVTVSASDEAGNVYTVDSTRAYGGTGACTSALLSAPVTTPLAPGQTITVTVSSGKAWGFAADAWHGIVATDQAGAADSASTKSAVVSVQTADATAQADEAVIAATCIAGTATITPAAGYTLSASLALPGSQSRRLGGEHRNVSAAGLQTATFGLDAARNWSAVVATYAGAAVPPPPAPTVADFTPTSGTAGTSVTISGTGFTDATRVTFDAADATTFNVDSDTSLTATVPAGATSGPICVTNASGPGCSSNPFTITLSVSYIGQVGSTSTAGGVIQNTLSVTVGPGGVPAGDTVVLGVAASGAVSVSAADDAGNAYHLDVTRPYNGTNPCTSAILSSHLVTPLLQGQSITVTVSSGKAWGFVADRWAGLADGVDQTGAGDSGGSTSANASVATTATTQAPEAVIGVVCANGQPGVNAGPGSTLSIDMPIENGSFAKRELGVGYKLASSSGVQVASFQLGAARNWSAVAATYP